MLGDWIKRERKVRNWTQAELARRVGTSGTYIGHLEANRRTDPRGDILEGLAHAFEISIEQVRKEARGLPETFPAERLRKEGLPEPYIARMTRLWMRYPERRARYLETAQKLARSTTEFEELTAELGSDEGNNPEVEPIPRPIAS